MRVALFLLALLWMIGDIARGQEPQALPDAAQADTAAQRGQLVDTAYFGRPLQFDEIVVTATRSLRALEQVSVPTSVIGAADIEARGAGRLSNLLAEQPGLQPDYNHSAGLQVQGFDADYTLILSRK